MMVEVVEIQDIEKIDSGEIKTYLKKRFEQLQYPLRAAIDGYFLYVDNPALFDQEHTLRHVTLPTIEQGLFRHIEGVEIEDNTIEISLLRNNEFLLSIVLPKSHCDDKFLQMVNQGE